MVYIYIQLDLVLFNGDVKMNIDQFLFNVEEEVIWKEIVNFVEIKVLKIWVNRLNFQIYREVIVCIIELWEDIQ